MTTPEVANHNAETRTEDVVTPLVEIFEDDQTLFVSADLPGVAPGDVEVALDGGRLSLVGRVAKSDRTSQRTYRRGFTLNDPSRFDTDHISAVLRHGVLEVRVPKAERAKPRQINVTTH